MEPCFLSLDLEVSKRDDRIHALAAIRTDRDQSLVCGDLHAGILAGALTHLDDFADGANFLLGHNLIDFDLPRLKAAKPDLRLLKLPAVDTLRLNPLAFPLNPYHHLVKHYQDGQLKRGRLNDPELDAGLTLKVFDSQQTALRDAPLELLAAWHWLTGKEPDGAGFTAVFEAIRYAPRPTEAAAHAAISERLAGNACQNSMGDMMAKAAQNGWPLAYALAWLSVAGGNSVMPPWVRHQFPEAGRLVRQLRDTACTDAACGWCRERHDARKELKRWFGFDAFRPEPSSADGRPMQQAIIEAAMAKEHMLGILPTGTGKSLCYQIPALSRYDKTGVLTVVISPLVALMADQVAGLEAHGIGSCVAINGLLSLPERSDALDRVRLGDVSILIVSPEQLRSPSLRRVIDQREIGAWVLDEAHCLSKWGHDFRPDYRYVGRFIREKAGKEPIPPVLCLTATAKPDVVADLKQHFRDELNIGLKVFDGGAQRTNLEFTVVPTTEGEKLPHIHQVLMADLPPDAPGGAIVYCSKRRRTEEVAEFLQAKGIAADYFHSKLPPESKKSVQQGFIGGELRVIAATNAFGMGIDKPDVRLVIHADIPGSLENYLQEAGRAGRDRNPARCVLFYTPEDVENQFSMSARSRLTRQEIHGVLRALRNLDRKKRHSGEVVATAGEILSEDDEKAFERDSTTDDTRVRTAVAWLEDAVLLTREENRVQVFPSSLRVSSKEEVEAKLKKKPIAAVYRRQLQAIAESLIDADPDQGISTDDLTEVARLSAEGVRTALHDLERLGIASNDTALTAFVHSGVKDHSRKRFEEAVELEVASLAGDQLLDGDTGGALVERHPHHQHLRDQLLADAPRAGGEGDQQGELDGPADAAREEARVHDHRRALGDGRGHLEVVAQPVEEEALVEPLEEGLVARVREVLADARQPEPPVVVAEGEGLDHRRDGPVPERRIRHDRLVERRERHQPPVRGRGDGDVDGGVQPDVAREGAGGEQVAGQQPAGRPAPAVVLIAVEREFAGRRAHGLETATHGRLPP